jgi:hypothetical protein
MALKVIIAQRGRGLWRMNVVIMKDVSFLVAMETAPKILAHGS